MSIAAYTFPVNAPSDLVWRILADSAAMPQRFDSSVDSVRILQNDERGLLREVVRNGKKRCELVTLDASSGSLTATLVDDADYTGSLTLRAEAANPSSGGHNHPRVSARLAWQSKSGSETEDQARELSRALEAQLLQLKHAAEERAGGHDETA